MTTEDAPASRGRRAREVTTLPDRGTVLVRSGGPPRVPADRCVDVRPGPFATFDGDRLWMPLSVCYGGERRRFDRSELSDVEDAVVAALRGPDSTVAGDQTAGDGTAGDRTASDWTVGDRTAGDRTTEDQIARDRNAGDRCRRSVDEDGRAVLRFGDLAACRRVLPTAAVAAIERRLDVAASRGSAAMLTWTTGDPRPGDGRRYDVVLDPPPDRSD